MNNKVETTREKILKAANKNPEAKRVLMDLYPDVFENNTVLCKIGSIFFRKKYPNNIYAIVKKGSNVNVLNINYSALWAEKKQIKISELKDFNRESITVSEFSKLTGYTDMSEFVIVDKSQFTKLFALIIPFAVKR